MQLVVLAKIPDDAPSFGDLVMTKGSISPPPDMVAAGITANFFI